MQFCIALLSFFYNHAISLSFWLLAFCLLKFQFIPEPAFYIFFYLSSIPYFLYLVRSFLRFLIQFNAQHDYIFLTEDFQSNSMTIASVCLCSTVIIVFSAKRIWQ